MSKNYLILLGLSLIGLITFLSTFIVLIIFFKRIITSNKYGFLILILLSLVMIVISSNIFIRCYKDFKYYRSGTCIEHIGTVVEFTYIKRDYDGTGELMNRKPKFFIAETGEYIVLNTKNVIVGETYKIKYYPNTKICEVEKYTDNSSQ